MSTKTLSNLIREAESLTGDERLQTWPYIFLKRLERPELNLDHVVNGLSSVALLQVPWWARMLRIGFRVADVNPMTDATNNGSPPNEH